MHFFFRFLCTLLLVLCSFFSFAQKTKPDSLRHIINTSAIDSVRINALNDLSRVYWQSSVYDSAMLYASKSITLCKTVLQSCPAGNPKTKNLRNSILNKESRALLNMGYTYGNQGKYKEALDNFHEAAKLREETGDKKGLANLLNNIGLVNQLRGNYPEALKSHFASLTIKQELHDSAGIAGSYSNIGIIYGEMEDYKDALPNFSAAKKIFEKTGDQEGVAETLEDIANIHILQGDSVSGLNELQTALKIFQALDNQQNIGRTYVGLADIYNGHKNYDEGLKNLFAGLRIFDSIGDQPNYGMTSIAIGTVYGETKKYPEALDYLNKGLKIALEIGSKEDIKSAYKSLSDVYSQTKDYKKAFESYEQYTIYKDSLYSEDKNKEIGKLEAKSEFDLQKGISDAEHRKEIEKKDELAAAADQRKNVIIFSITLGLILVAIFLVFLFNRFRVTKKQKQIIEIKNKETEHQKEIIEEKQKEIIDSINYAKRIQYALLAHEHLLKENLTDHFVFFKPKDIVSGDFYWATKTIGGRQSAERFYLAVCDSTGHGVPGAFMSLLNISYLNEAVIEKNIAEPNEILNHVRQRLIENISSSRDASGGGQDGMDAILICIDKTNNKLTYAAAHNSPVIVHNGIIKTLEADKMPVGKGEKMDGFTLKTIDIQKGDSLYLYTDGYADQFGGEKGKKFKYKQLNELLLAGSQSTFETQKDILSKRLDEWKGNLEQVDDVCMIGIRF